MELLVVNDKYELEVNPLALGISFIRELMDEDKSKSKELATKRLTYVAMMYTAHLDYFLNNPDEELRSEVILSDIEVKDKTAFITDKTKAVGEWFKKRSKEEISSVLYNAAASAADTVRKRLEDTNTLLGMLKKNGDPVYTLKDILGTLNMIPDTMDKLNTARNKVIAKKDEGRTEFGAKTKNLFEDGIGLDEL